MSGEATYTAVGPMAGYRRVAVFEGHGDAAEVYLEYEHLETDDVIDISVPADWPAWITGDFVRSMGFEVVRA